MNHQRNVPPSGRNACLAVVWGLINCAAIVLTGCATPSAGTSEMHPESVAIRRASAVAAPRVVDAVVANKILALNPRHITEHDLAILASGPTPQIVLLHGGVYGTQFLMMSFAKFLIGMGYPEWKIRDPSNGAYSQNPLGSSERLAGEIAWYYERDGVRPMMVGHSQGGIQAVKVLYELNGAFADKLAVWNAVTDTREERDTIVDPLAGTRRSVVGVSLAYVSVVGAGGVALASPGHWAMAQRLHNIPDVVEDFTGFAIDYDPIAWTFPSRDNAPLYRRDGTASVRNVTLPESYSHVFVPETQALSADLKIRDWLNAFVPGADNGPPPGANEGRANNALWAADVWFSIKEHWCVEAQRLIRARRASIAAR
jgi:hypothetical protein